MAWDFNRPSLSERPFFHFLFNNKVSEQKCKDGFFTILTFFVASIGTKLVNRLCLMFEGPA